MPSGVFNSILLKHLWGTDELRAVFNDENRVQKWFDYEAALALAQAELGIIPQAAADEIARKAKVGNVDLEAIAAEIRRIKHPLVPALRALQAVCADGHGEYLHFGPTTQDVLDTGTVLQLQGGARASSCATCSAIGRELYRARRNVQGYADGRAAPTRCRRCRSPSATNARSGSPRPARNYERLRQLEKRIFVGSLVGAVGTKASFGDRAFELDAKVMARLGLGVADISWQPARDRLVEYVGVLGLDRRQPRQDRRRDRRASRTTRSTSSPSRSTRARSAPRPCRTSAIPSIAEGVVAVGRTLRHDRRAHARRADPGARARRHRRGGSNGRRCPRPA